jgi:hypothetical protein
MDRKNILWCLAVVTLFFAFSLTAALFASPTPVHFFRLQNCEHWGHLGPIPAEEIPAEVRKKLILEHEEEIKRLRSPDKVEYNFDPSSFPGPMLYKV